MAIFNDSNKYMLVLMKLCYYSDLNYSSAEIHPRHAGRPIQGQHEVGLGEALKSVAEKSVTERERKRYFALLLDIPNC